MIVQRYGLWNEEQMRYVDVIYAFAACNENTTPPNQKGLHLSPSNNIFCLKPIFDTETRYLADYSSIRANRSAPGYRVVYRAVALWEGDS
jgi:hypothetical protein